MQFTTLISLTFISVIVALPGSSYSNGNSYGNNNNRHGHITHRQNYNKDTFVNNRHHSKNYGNKINHKSNYGGSYGSANFESQRCVEGTLFCDNSTGGFYTCAQASYVYRACGPGTVCRSQGRNNVFCGSP